VSEATSRILLWAWLWFAVLRLVFFSAMWWYVEAIMKINEPPIITALSFWAVIESALAVLIATIVALMQNRNGGSDAK
jgi:hypothetical protein